MRRLAICLLGVFLSAAAAAETLGLRAYRDAVARLEAALHAGDLATVHREASALLGATVETGDRSAVADSTLFEPLAAAETLADAAPFAPRLGALRRALDAVDGQEPAPVDRGLLASLAAAEATERPAGEGFDIAEDGGVFQALGDLLRPIRDFVAKVWREFWEWVLDFLRSERADGGWLAGLDLPSLVSVLVVVFALALGVLAIRAWRARRRPAAVTSASLAPPHPADDDPLSRDEGGWQRYARELAAAGRTREAIRAWYHAVLVSLYGRGLVTYRKGRTNWEVVAALSPALACRPTFIELTRLFDREWYGLRQSPPEALTEAEDFARELLADLAEPSGRAA